MKKFLKKTAIFIVTGFLITNTTACSSIFSNPGKKSNAQTSSSLPDDTDDVTADETQVPTKSGGITISVTSGSGNVNSEAKQFQSLKEAVKYAEINLKVVSEIEDTEPTSYSAITGQQITAIFNNKKGNHKIIFSKTHQTETDQADKDTKTETILGTEVSIDSTGASWNSNSYHYVLLADNLSESTLKEIVQSLIAVNE